LIAASLLPLDQCYVLVIKLVSPEDALRATNPSLEAKIRGVYLPAGVALIGAMELILRDDWRFLSGAVTDGKNTEMPSV